MRFFFLILTLYCSNILSLEQNQPQDQVNFFNKNPAEQRDIFVNKIINIFNKKNTTSEKPTEPLTNNINNIETVESLLMKCLDLISNGELDKASQIIDKLIVLAPNFKLAHLIRGDILTAYSMSIDNFGGSAIKINANKVKELKKEAQRRIKGYLTLNKNNILPKFNILPSKTDKYLIYVDMDSSRLFVFQNINAKYLYLSDYYVSIGKNGYGKRFEGDKKTPFGTYFIEKKIQRQLIDFYGEGAYPLDYPNEYDKVNRFTGSGIWIHGTPKSTYSRPPEASDGCIVLSNNDLLEIENVLNTIDTPIILSNLSINELSLRTEDNIKEDQKRLLNSIEKWRRSWISANYPEYINFYSNDAMYNNSIYKKWTYIKKTVLKKSKDIKISISDISIYEYPSIDGQLRIVFFKQNYSSNLITNTTKKKQLWKEKNGEWKIIYEGTI